ncbi:hypothetical protein ACOJUR_12445 [Alicyclobacillus tolerans]
MSQTDLERILKAFTETLSIHLLETFNHVEIDIHVHAMNETEKLDR